MTRRSAFAIAAAATAIGPASAGIIVPTSQVRWASATVGDIHNRIDSPDFARFAETARLDANGLSAESSQDTTIGASSIFGTMGGRVTPGAASTFNWCQVGFEMTVDGTYTIEAATPYLGGFVMYVWDAEGSAIFDRPFSSMDGNFLYEDVIPAGDYTMLVAVFSNGDGTGYLDVGGSFAISFVPAPGAVTFFACALLGAPRRRTTRRAIACGNSRP